jgi:cell division transport system permease protein
MAKTNKPTQFYATISTSIVLILVSIFLLIFLHSGNITNIVKQKINILIELENDLPSAEVRRIISIVKSYEGVLPNSVNYVSKDDALATMSKELVVSKDNEDNPFQDIIIFNLRSEAYSEKLINEIKYKIELEKGILGLYHENESLDQVKKNLGKVSLGILILAICFVILALSIIFNTIQLTLYSDLKEIKTMQMVGALDSFIKKPYLRMAFWMAIKSGFSMIVFIVGLCTYGYYADGIFSEIIQWSYVAVALMISILLAICLQILATHYILSRFLAKENR